MNNNTIGTDGLEDHFNNHATAYEAATRRLKYIAPETMVDLAVPYFNINKPILDIGAGTGLVGSRLTKKGFVVDGIDSSDKMLEMARARGYRNLILADIKEPHIDNGSYQALISVGAYVDYVHLKFIEKASKILDEHGVLAIACRAQGVKQSLLDVLRQEGFTPKVQAYNTGHYVGGFCDQLCPIQYFYTVAIR